MLNRLVIPAPDDWHVHLRDGDALRCVVGATARHFKRAIVMPNLKPPVASVPAALAYRQRILEAVQQASLDPGLSRAEQAYMADFQPLMVLYLTASTTVQDIEAAKASGVVHGVKLYPAGATTHSEAGVSDLLAQCSAVLAAMQQLDMPLLVHGEVTDPSVDVFDREAVFIERVMQPLRARFPALRVVFEHITTAQAVQFVQSHAQRDTKGRLLLAATITPQHLLYSRNALFQGGLQPHWYCLPVLKRETHRQALLQAATSGSAQFFLGTDSAPHSRHLKEMSCGCAGCYSAPYALALYAEAFEEAGALHSVDAFAGFCSQHGPAFYGLPQNTGTVVLEKRPTPVPDRLPFVTDSGIVPLRAGEVLPWAVQAAWNFSGPKAT